MTNARRRRVRLSDADVQRVRALYDQQRPLSEIAVLFGIDTSTVCRLGKRERRARVPEETA